MLTIGSIIRGFGRGIVSNRVSLVGAVVTILLFPILLLYSALDVLGLVDDPMLSFVVYGGLTWIFVFGHLMLFTGLFILKNRRGTTLFSSEEFKESFAEPTRFGNVRRLVLFVTLMTLFNLAVVGASAYNGFLYSESTDFCGKLCHGVMTPELTAYESSPHSRVECVECHIGSGATWFVRSKLSGIRQLVAVALDSYSQPIRTPIHGLRPARDTCEECHRPELLHGDRLKVIEGFLEDEASTHVRSVMLMKVGSGDDYDQQAQGSHWHVARNKQIYYRHTDEKRIDITRVDLIGSDGIETFLPAGGEAASVDGEARLMDCLDCHNRPTHVYRSADEALDRKLFEGEIPRELPFIKRQAMEWIQAEYPSRAHATEIIPRELRAWYGEHYPELAAREPSLLDTAADAVVAAYTENVFPEMKVGFGTYERHLGHERGAGCFRCHGTLRTRDNRAVSRDCELCHLILTEREPVLAQTVGQTLLSAAGR
jgi:hypothetical protein